VRAEDIEEVVCDDEVVEKCERKHNVDLTEISETLDNDPQIHFVEYGNREGEDVYVAEGRTNSGRYLKIFFIRKSSRKIRLATAREMTKAERKAYGKK
jgi:uncharacterized DUF497 family protein